jgi:transcriptional regulator with XRE-family HTH domain
MILGDRLRAIRETKLLSQGDIEERTGLLRSYVSRVENGHTVPTIDTLEKWARALEIPMYQLFYDGEAPASLPKPLSRLGASDILWGSTGRQASLLDKLRRALRRMNEPQRKLLLAMANRINSSKSRQGSK